MRRRWLVVALFAGRWVVDARRWTRSGAERASRRRSKDGLFPGLLTPVESLVGGVGFCHEDEFADLPEVAS